MCQLLLLTIFGTLLLSVLADYQYFLKQTRAELRREADFICYAIRQSTAGSTAFFDAMPQETRLTLIDREGRVLFDNAAATDRMESHAQRPEIQSAFAVGEGEAARFSATLDVQTFYYAKRLPDGTVVRLARSTSSIVRRLLDTLPILLLLTFAAACIALLFARRISRSLLEPINHLNLSAPLENVSVYDELSPLLRRLDQQQKKIREQFHKIEAQKLEFDTIIENINEGLIVVNRKMRILSINQSAAQIFSAKREDSIGKDLLRFTYNLNLKEIAQKGLQNRQAETVLELGERAYQLIASPVYKNSRLEGAFLIFIDITEKRFAEKLRREFSANVSHELKTPLTSISGFAELIQKALAKPEDIAGFAGRIHSEARRMLALINDIIKLSKLDEESPEFTAEPLDLNELVEDELYRLRPVASERKIVLFFARGALPPFVGVRSLLDELVYNLLENAIKYNRLQGRVEVATALAQDEILLTVEDTGIGIPAEHQSRIFERFYRVDKSRSRQLGGTGLGLSIVKHIANYHHAKIQIESRENAGTKITVRFPLEKAGPVE